jgi:hypothetical protein
VCALLEASRCLSAPTVELLTALLIGTNFRVLGSFLVSFTPTVLRLALSAARLTCCEDLLGFHPMTNEQLTAHYTDTRLLFAFRCGLVHLSLMNERIRSGTRKVTMLSYLELEWVFTLFLSERLLAVWMLAVLYVGGRDAFACRGRTQGSTGFHYLPLL